METKGILFFLPAVLLTIVLAAAACAYDAMPTPEDMGLNYSVTAGVVSSVNSNIDNGTRPTGGFAWYGPADPAFGDMAAFGLSADWIGVKRNDGKDISLAPVLLNYKQSGIISGYRVFVTLGLGIRYATDQIPEMKLGSGTSFAWEGGLGLDLTNQIFIHARFIAGENPGQDGLVATELGYRF